MCKDLPDNIDTFYYILNLILDLSYILSLLIKYSKIHIGYYICKEMSMRSSLIDIFYLLYDYSEDEMTLFPAKSKDSSKHKQDLTDTFSIGELSDESEDSLNLDPAQPPRPFMRTYVPSGCFACHCHIL